MNIAQKSNALSASSMGHMFTVGRAPSGCNIKKASGNVIKKLFKNDLKQVKIAFKNLAKAYSKTVNSVCKDPIVTEGEKYIITGMGLSASVVIYI